MKHTKHTLFYRLDFLLNWKNRKTSLFTKKNFSRFVLFLFTLVILHSNFSFSLASTYSSKHSFESHNGQKMSSRISTFLDAHDSITPEMKEIAIQKVIDFNTDFNIISTNESKTLRRLFFFVQETFLKEYVLYSSFYQTIDSGKFDCLTGSLLYAVFLEEIKRKGNFDYNYQIIQMPTHVFVKIELSDKSEMIFESTSFEKGFIATQKGIEFYLQKQNKEAQQNQKTENILVLKNQKLNNLVTLESASALLYFNQGVLFFNQRKFGKTLKMAKKAFSLQENEAFYELMQLSLYKLKKENNRNENNYAINN